jgi:hypothetical protein
MLQHGECNSVRSYLMGEVIGDIHSITTTLEYFIHSDMN